MAKTAKSFSEVEPISKTFKNQPVEIYVQQNNFYVGFNNVFFKGDCLYNTFENKKFLCMDIMLTATSPLLEPIKATEVVKMVVDGEQYSINDPEYVHKRFIWDTEDCFEVPVDFLRAGDIIKGSKGFMLCLGQRADQELKLDHVLVLDLETGKPQLINSEKLKGLKTYRHIKLWN